MESRNVLTLAKSEGGVQFGFVREIDAGVLTLWIFPLQQEKERADARERVWTYAAAKPLSVDLPPAKSGNLVSGALAESMKKGDVPQRFRFFREKRQRRLGLICMEAVPLPVPRTAAVPCPKKAGYLTRSPRRKGQSQNCRRAPRFSGR